jgi:hypothetical protein
MNQMNRYPLVAKLICVAAIAVIMLPVGGMLLPHVSNMMGSTEFKTLEAVVSAGLGYGLYIAMFG